ncbi:hypothetical protein P691DRAFT_781790 [Macrolepiota fuliginosa MF-IS2]|uniref:Uncharacterized protein n=1 Tax=Macrolepiota fuliginosa MF-IS2 TaxID=1400762 RepID=A0A9P6BWD5_9AGAR|nr:hypothetical protein P691DRAFT_781790 [Macrolepiota fuliginosa MF-IS2]
MYAYNSRFIGTRLVLIYSTIPQTALDWYLRDLLSKKRWREMVCTLSSTTAMSATVVFWYNTAGVGKWALILLPPPASEQAAWSPTIRACSSRVRRWKSQTRSASGTGQHHGYEVLYPRIARELNGNQELWLLQISSAPKSMWIDLRMGSPLSSVPRQNPIITAAPSVSISTLEFNVLNEPSTHVARRIGWLTWTESDFSQPFSVWLVNANGIHNAQVSRVVHKMRLVAIYHGITDEDGSARKGVMQMEWAKVLSLRCGYLANIPAQLLHTIQLSSPQPNTCLVFISVGTFFACGGGGAILRLIRLRLHYDLEHDLYTLELTRRMARRDRVWTETQKQIKDVEGDGYAGSWVASTGTTGIITGSWIVGATSPMQGLGKLKPADGEYQLQWGAEVVLGLGGRVGDLVA